MASLVWANRRTYRLYLPNAGAVPMNGRSSAVRRRTRPHVPIESADVPGCCSICSLLIGKPPYPSELHIDRLPAVDPDITAAEARRLGEHD